MSIAASSQKMNINLRSNIKKSLGTRPLHLVHQSSDPHFIPLLSKEHGLTIRLTNRWKEEVTKMIPKGDVFFEICEDLGLNRNRSIGVVENLNINEDLKIDFFNAINSPKVKYEFFVADKTGKKIWTSFYSTQVVELSDGQQGTDGWAHIRVNDNLRVPYKYDHDQNANKPLIEISSTTQDLMDLSRGFKFMIYHSMWLHVLSIYISDAKKEDPIIKDWFKEIMMGLNDGQPIQSNEDNDDIEMIIEETQYEDLLVWLNDVTANIYEQGGNDDIFEKFLEKVKEVSE